MSVLCNSFIIIDHLNLGLSGLSAMLVISLGSTIGQQILYTKLGDLYEASNSFIGSWRGIQSNALPMDRRLMMKYLASCRPMRIELGNYNYLRKSTSIIVSSKTIIYTSKMLLMINQ